MKKIITKLSVAFVLCSQILALNACKSFLDTYDPSNVNDTYYNTKIGQEKLIVDLFSKSRNLYSNYYLQDYGTDMYLACDESPTSVHFNGYGQELSGLSSLIDSYWSLLYKMIQESNILLNRCTPEIAGSDYDSYVAQGKFFRALAYYYLVETFGGVPLLTKENTDANSIIKNVTREPEENIYKFIIEELEDIKNDLPASASASNLSCWAVKHTLGKFYLTRAYRSYAQADDAKKAADLFTEVIESGKYSLQAKFADVFNEENQSNSEIVWAVQYGSDKNYNGSGNNQSAMYGVNITALYPGLFALDQKEYSSMQRDIWTNPRVHEWFRYPEADSRYDATFRFEFPINDTSNKEYGSMGIYMPHWNDASGDTHGAKYFYPFLNSEGDYNWYPALGCIGWSTDCMPICKKFKETKIEWGGKGTREDVVIRLADTYLLRAEAYLLSNNKPAATADVNVILKRAAGNDTNYNTLKLSESDMDIDRLLEERGCEMFGEHDRWFDLKRTGTLLDRALLNPLVVYYNNISEINLVRPIPYNERIKLEGLGQNPGYKN